MLSFVLLLSRFLLTEPTKLNFLHLFISLIFGCLTYWENILQSKIVFDNS